MLLRKVLKAAVYPKLVRQNVAIINASKGARGLFVFIKHLSIFTQNSISQN